MIFCIRKVVPAVALAIAVALPSAGKAQQTIDYGSGPLMNHVETLRVLGWSTDERFFGYDSGLNGAGAMGIEERLIKDTRSQLRGLFRWEEEGQTAEAWLTAQSGAMLANLGISGQAQGHLVYQFPTTFFRPNKRIKAWSDLKRQYTFTMQGSNYRIEMNQTFSPTYRNVPGPDGTAARYRPARVSVRVFPAGASSILLGIEDDPDAVGYGIERIYVSPNRQYVAVVLVRFTMKWFEGVNISAEHVALVGRIR